jgi:uncharacterized repeat protein (TIGR03803 family)
VDTSGKETVIHKFFGGGGGAVPHVGLLDVGGALYGTTIIGGDPSCDGGYGGGGCGVLYKIGKTGQYTVVHRFEGNASGDGYYSSLGGLTLGTDGSIYGTTWWGGVRETICNGGEFTFGCGVIFKYTP